MLVGLARHLSPHRAQQPRHHALAPLATGYRARPPTAPRHRLPPPLLSPLGPAGAARLHVPVAKRGSATNRKSSCRDVLFCAKIVWLLSGTGGGRTAMQQFVNKYAQQIAGVLSGFDRLVFRGLLRRLNYGWWDKSLRLFISTGMEQYLLQNKILFKDYFQHVKRLSQRLRNSSVRLFQEQGLPIIFERNPEIDKDELARGVALKRNIDAGLVCAITTAEMCTTFEHRGTHIVRRERPCGVVYQYQIHPEVGWMYARIQTWFPFHIQVGLNGREWLGRQMKREGLKYRQQGNCFVW